MVPPALPYQWRVDLATGRATEKMISGIHGEFPKINDAYTGRPTRYGYFVTTRGWRTTPCPTDWPATTISSIAPPSSGDRTA
ncbi:carotenoid oxygenase family protein [Streptomyces sp. NPDC002643]